MPLDITQRSYYGLCFRVAYLEKRGTEFQDWFVRLARFALGSDFEAVRPYGRQGDLKCDGYQVSTRTVFQCYAPHRMKDRALIKKIIEDYDGALKHWGSRMDRWVLVHNDERGLPPSVVQEIDGLRNARPEIAIETWGEPELLKMKERLGLEDLGALFGFAPTLSSTESLGMEDLQPVIDALQRKDPTPGGEPAAPQSAEKLERNCLSDDAIELLRWGRRKEELVAKYFRTDPRPDLGERVAEAFRSRYTSLRGRGLAPDEVLFRLQMQAGGSQVSTPKRQGAVLAVPSYFFERCDIFEDPESAQ